MSTELKMLFGHQAEAVTADVIKLTLYHKIWVNISTSRGDGSMWLS